MHDTWGAAAERRERGIREGQVPSSPEGRPLAAHLGITSYSAIPELMLSKHPESRSLS